MRAYSPRPRWCINPGDIDLALALGWTPSPDYTLWSNKKLGETQVGNGYSLPPKVAYEVAAHRVMSRKAEKDWCSKIGLNHG